MFLITATFWIKVVIVVTGIVVLLSLAQMIKGDEKDDTNKDQN